MTTNTALTISANSFFAFDPAPEQSRAVELAAQHKAIIITGGPGVGKTATTNAVIGLFEANGLDVACCAPTGKAAQRMAEQTGREASTIHRLLGFTGDGWKHNAENPLPVDALIVDEASMVDSELFAALLAALPTKARLVIVGDVDQLPSIGAGRVLYDLIESGVIPTVRLTKIFRQAEESRIPYIARDINTGATPDLASCTKDGDVIFAGTSDAEDILAGVVSAFRTHLRNRGFAQDDIQVLVPQRTKTCGVENLNAVLQRELNPNAYDGNVSVKITGADVYEGDRVIHTKNNYKLMTFNGEIGKVVACNWRGLRDIGEAVFAGFFENATPRENAHVVIVDYGDRKVAYSKEEAYDLQLAYAITIHKSQGSQFKAVIMPISPEHKFMLTRPLVYTGITRASEQLLIIGDAAALGEAAVNTRGVQRRTTLQAEVVDHVNTNA